MAQCKQTPYEYIQNAFSPQVAILCSEDADNLCLKNNLTFVELIQPFSRLNNEIRIADPSGSTAPIKNLRIVFEDMNRRPPQPTLAEKLLSDVVANTPWDRSATRTVGASGTRGAIDLELQPTTPWYESWRDTFLHIQYPSDHEFTKHYLACIVVIASTSESPMDQLGKLNQYLHQQLHQQPSRFPKWFSPNILKYYLLLHDITVGDIAKAEQILEQMTNQYGGINCHMLQINSRALENTDTQLPDPWSQFLAHRASCELSGGSSSETSSGTGTPREDVSGLPTRVTEGDNPDCCEPIHPLSPAANLDEKNAIESMPGVEISSDVPVMVDRPVPHSSAHHHGGCLTSSDLDRIRIFVHEFCVRSLVPHTERQIRYLNDVVTNRSRSKSLLSATRRWLAGNKSPGATANSVIYSSEATELQTRRLADLCFMFCLYELAYSFYHTAKNDFKSDQAWIYFAGAQEMAALSAFMHNSADYPKRYLQNSLHTYLNVCKVYNFAVRSTILSGEVLRHCQEYGDAAMTFIKLTSENSDLLSALMLEQAAHCFIHSQRPLPRKYAFHMTLAGHRFSKAAQRAHSLRAYQQAFQVYASRGWVLAEDHIHFTMGKQAHHLKSPLDSLQAYTNLVDQKSKKSSPSQQSPAQQVTYVREFIAAFHQFVQQKWEPHMAVPYLPIPIIVPQETRVLLGLPQDLPKDLNFPKDPQKELSLQKCPKNDLSFPKNPQKDLSLQKSPQRDLPKDQELTREGLGLPKDPPKDLPQQNAPSWVPASHFSLDHTLGDAKRWFALEREVVVADRGASLLAIRPNLQLLGPCTPNSQSPIVPVNELIIVEILVKNPLAVSLVISEMRLVYRWEEESEASQRRAKGGGGGGGDNNTHRGGREKGDNLNSGGQSDTSKGGGGGQSEMNEEREKEDNLNSNNCPQVEFQYSSFNLLAGTEERVKLSLVPLSPGKIFVTGVQYKVSLAPEGPLNSLSTQNSTQIQPNSAQNSPHAQRNAQNSTLSQASTQNSALNSTQSQNSTQNCPHSAVIIEGQQGIEVKGPRLNTNAAEKCGVIYAKDMRLEVTVTTPMARLGVAFKDIPQILSCGEICSSDAIITNVGPKAVSKLFLGVSDPRNVYLEIVNENMNEKGNKKENKNEKWDNMNEKGNNKNENKEKGENKNEKGNMKGNKKEIMNELNEKSQIIMENDENVNKIKILSEVEAADCRIKGRVERIQLNGDNNGDNNSENSGLLMPGGSIRAKLWLHAPLCPGTFDIELLFYYETLDLHGKNMYRLVRHHESIYVERSLSLKVASAVSQNLETLSIESGENSAKTFSSNLIIEAVNSSEVDSSCESYTVVGIGANSKKWAVYPHSKLKYQQLHIGESCHLCVKNIQRFDIDKNNIILSQLNFEGAQDIIDSWWRFSLRTRIRLRDMLADPLPPNANTDNSNVGTSNKHKDAGFINDANSLDTVVTLCWKSERGGKTIYGQHSVYLESLGENCSVPAQVVGAPEEERPPIRIIPEDPIQFAPSPLPPPGKQRHLVKISAEFPKPILHDFSANKLCCVEFELDLYNCSACHITTFLNLSPENQQASGGNTSSQMYSPQASTQLLYVGGIIRRADIGPWGHKSVPVRALVTGPGTYSVGSFSVTAVRRGAEKDEQPIPQFCQLQTAVVVRQSRDRQTRDA